jgi:hypothetical protein
MWWFGKRDWLWIGLKWNNNSNLYGSYGGKFRLALIKYVNRQNVETPLQNTVTHNKIEKFVPMVYWYNYCVLSIIYLPVFLFKTTFRRLDSVSVSVSGFYLKTETEYSLPNVGCWIMSKNTVIVLWHMFNNSVLGLNKVSPYWITHYIKWGSFTISKKVVEKSTFNYKNSEESITNLQVHVRVVYFILMLMKLEQMFELGFNNLLNLLITLISFWSIRLENNVK